MLREEVGGDEKDSVVEAEPQWPKLPAEVGAFIQFRLRRPGSGIPYLNFYLLIEHYMNKYSLLKR
jgi:hypothetical protein